MGVFVVFISSYKPIHRSTYYATLRNLCSW